MVSEHADCGGARSRRTQGVPVPAPHPQHRRSPGGRQGDLCGCSTTGGRSAALSSNWRSASCAAAARPAAPVPRLACDRPPIDADGRQPRDARRSGRPAPLLLGSPEPALLGRGTSCGRHNPSCCGGSAASSCGEGGPWRL